MTAETVFFSWQLDTDRKTGKNFLQDAMREACKQLSKDPEFVEAERDFEADSDTSGVSGQPHIATTILSKIEAATVFVADLTYVGSTDNHKKRIPNANVMLEYGWALKVLGPNRILSLMNTAYGAPDTHPLPFDLDHFRWPIQFKLPPDADKSTTKQVLASLVHDLKKALRSLLVHNSEEREASAPQHVARQPLHGRSRFRRPDQVVGETWEPLMPFPLLPKRRVLFAEGPTMYLRLIPERSIATPLNDMRMADAALQTGAFRLRPFTSGQDIHQLRAEDGIGMCWMINSDNRTESVAFAFEDGEIWSVDSALLRSSRTDILPAYEIESAFMDGLKNYLGFLRYLGLQGRYKWIAGLEGASGRRFFFSATMGHLQPFYGQDLLSDRLEVDGIISIETTDVASALEPFFSRIYQKCSLDFRRLRTS